MKKIFSIGTMRIQSTSLKHCLALITIVTVFCAQGDGGTTTRIFNPWDLRIDYNPSNDSVEIYTVENKKKLVQGTELFRFALKGKVRASCEKTWLDWYQKQARAKVGTLMNQNEAAKVAKKEVRIVKEGRRLAINVPPGSQSGHDVEMDALSYRADMLLNKLEEVISNPLAACPPKK